MTTCFESFVASSVCPRVLVLACHPDDETIGAGGLLRRLCGSSARVAVAHLTDGAPDDLSDAYARGFDSPDDYASARRAELQAALCCLPSLPDLFALGFRDQRVSERLPDVIAAVRTVIDAWQPSVVLTHPYEGGHPDHDAAALAAALAIRGGFGYAPLLFEFTSYHLWHGELRAGVFLDNRAGAPWILPLDVRARAAKRRMLDCFATQQDTLQYFDSPPRELFRPAPAYDFRQPPHPPPLFYDFFQWGTRSGEWQQRAAALLDEVEAGGARCL